jgi:hypothetical protein
MGTIEGSEAGRPGLIGDHMQERVAARRQRYRVPVIYEELRAAQRISADERDRQAEGVL